MQKNPQMILVDKQLAIGKYEFGFCFYFSPRFQGLGVLLDNDVTQLSFTSYLEWVFKIKLLFLGFWVSCRTIR
jgi:hypothetical protein